MRTQLVCKVRETHEIRVMCACVYTPGNDYRQTHTYTHTHMGGGCVGGGGGSGVVMVVPWWWDGMCGSGVHIVARAETL